MAEDKCGKKMIAVNREVRHSENFPMLSICMNGGKDK